MERLAYSLRTLAVGRLVLFQIYEFPAAEYPVGYDDYPADDDPYRSGYDDGAAPRPGGAKTKGGKSSAVVSGAGSSVRSWMWQYSPNCFTHAAVAAEAEPAVGSGPGEAIEGPADGFGLSTKT